MKIIIPGNPIAKARHRRRKLFNGKVIDYDPQETEKFKVTSFLKWYVKCYFESNEKERLKEGQKMACDEAFEMHVTFHMPIAATDSELKRNAKLWGFIPHAQKPDCSNLLKFYEDAANEVLYRDDCQLTSVSAKKLWSNNPRTEINIMAIKTIIPDEVQILSLFSIDEFKNLALVLGQLPEIKEVLQWENLITEDQNRKTAAKILSEIADKYATRLQKISKKCPGYWQKEQPNA